MGRYLIGVVVGLALAMTLACAVSIGGWLNVGALWPDPRPVAWWLHTSYEKAVARRAADIRAPDTLDDPATVLAGAQAFDEMCSICHTPPGLSPTVQSQGLNPAPPQLPRMLSRRTPAQAFWVIRSGVRMTGMPAFGPSHSDAQLWQLVAFLKQAAGMDAAGYAQIQEQARQLPAGDGHHHRHGGAAGDTTTGRGEHCAGQEPTDPAQPAGDHHDH